MKLNNPIIIRKTITYISLIILVFLVLWVHKNWIFSLAPLSSGDWTYYFKGHLQEWGGLHRIWMDYESFGRPMIQINQALLFSSYSILSLIGFNYEFISRVFFFYPIALLAPVFAYLFIYRSTKSVVGSVFGTILYNFNSYFLIIKGGHMHLAFAYSLAPLVWYFFLSNRFKHNIYGLLVAFLISIYEVRMAPIILLFGFGLNIFFNWEKGKSIFKELVRAGSLALVYIALNFYWLITLVNLGRSSQHSSAFSQQPLNWISLVNSVTLHHPFWTNMNGVQDFVFNGPSFSYYILFVIIFGAIIVAYKKYEKIAVFYSFVITISVFLLSQENNPIPWLYSLVHNNVPFFGAFRESSKFFFFLSISYSVLLSVLVKEILNKLHKKSLRQNYLIFSSLLAILIVLVLPASSFFSGRYDKTFATREVTQTYQNLNEYSKNKALYKQKDLWVSRSPKFIQKASDKPIIDGSYLGRKVGNVFELGEVHENKYQYLNKTYSSWLLGKMGISNIYVYNDEDPNYEHYQGLNSYTYQTLLENKFQRSEPSPSFKSVHYTNKQKESYIRTSSQVFNINSFKNFEKYNSFFASQNTDFEVTTQPNVTGSIQMDAFFHNIHNLNLDSDGLVTDIEQGLFDQTLYNTLDKDLEWEVVNGTIKFSPIQNDQLTKNSLNSGEKVRVTNQGIKKAIYTDSSHDFDNKIPNPSFRKGGWQRSVRNCNNYDSNPDIDMRVTSRGFDNSGAVELSARRHHACTSVKTLALNPGGRYLFRFNYKGDQSAEDAGYLIDYNNNVDVISERIKLENEGWNEFSKVLNIPQNSESASIVLYAYETDGQKTSKVQYDNFSLIELPDVVSNLYVYDSLDKNLGNAKVEYLNQNSTQKLVKINSIKKPTYLLMNEGYHSNWVINLKNSKDKSLFKHDELLPDQNHFEINGFMNAWYIDPGYICQNHSQACTLKPDGSYDINLAIEFWPQRWFNFGSFVSGLALISVLAYLGYDYQKGKKETERSITLRKKHHPKIIPFPKKVLAVLGGYANQISIIAKPIRDNTQQRIQTLFESPAASKLIPKKPKRSKSFIKRIKWVNLKKRK